MVHKSWLYPLQQSDAPIFFFFLVLMSLHDEFIFGKLLVLVIYVLSSAKTNKNDNIQYYSS